jgi:hypothetical protein
MLTNIITAFVTAYVATGHPCANGKMPCIGHTVAVPRCYALGCDVLILGHHYKGEDRTARKFDGRFDIFVESEREAIQFGKQKLIVKVISK